LAQIRSGGTGAALAARIEVTRADDVIGRMNGAAGPRAFAGSSISRRGFALGAAGVLASCVAGQGCDRRRDSRQSPVATLRARPLTTVTTRDAGTQALDLGGARDAVLHLPPEIGSRPIPLVVLLHGAGGDGEGFVRGLLPLVGAARIALLAPDSRGSTWDAVLPVYRSLIDVLAPQPRLMGFGPDVAFLDRALERVFQLVSVDPEQIAIAGFSDGATYALSLGLLNGDLFNRIVAFSPGFITGDPRDLPGERPLVFVSHGLADGILPIDRSSRRIVPTLRERGYTVTYREFSGGHEIPDDVVREAIAWMTAPRNTPSQTGRGSSEAVRPGPE
jgi:phospholipase/carboxylesterase